MQVLPNSVNGTPITSTGLCTRQVPQFLSSLVSSSLYFCLHLLGLALTNVETKIHQIKYFLFPAFNLSGGYFNPILASALTFGCSGCTYKEHLLVYWVAAILGAIASKEAIKYYRAKKINLAKKEE